MKTRTTALGLIIATLTMLGAPPAASAAEMRGGCVTTRPITGLDDLCVNKG